MCFLAVDVSRHTGARRFYEKLGFRHLIGVGDEAAGTGGAFYMGLRLQPTIPPTFP